MLASVLFVHAGTDDRAMYAEYLRGKGCSVAEAATTDAALPLIDSADVVITGLLVGGTISAVELIERIRSRWSNSQKPIIVVTACVVPQLRIDAAQAGCDVILLKPCLPDTLLAELQRLLPKSRNGA